MPRISQQRNLLLSLLVLSAAQLFCIPFTFAESKPDENKRLIRVLLSDPSSTGTFDRLLRNAVLSDSVEKLKNDLYTLTKDQPNALVVLTQLHRRLGNDRDAITALKSARKALTDEPRIDWLLAQSHRNLDEQNKAIEHYQAALNRKLPPELRYEIALDAIEYLQWIEKRELAISILKNTSDSLAEESAIQKRFAMELAKLNFHQQAIEIAKVLSKQTENKQENIQFQILIAEWKSKTGLQADSLKIYEQLESEISEDHWLSSVLIEKIVELHNRVDHQVALAQYLQSKMDSLKSKTRFSQRDRNLVNHTSIAWQRIGYVSRAIDAVKFALDRELDDNQKRIWKIRIDELKQSVDLKAGTTKGSGGKIKPEEPSVESKKQVPKAVTIEQLEAAVTENPDSRIDHERLARGYAEIEDWKNAIAAYEKMKRKWPGDSIPYLKKLLPLYRLDKQNKTAIETAKALITISPDDLSIRFEFAELLIQAGEIDKAVQNLQSYWFETDLAVKPWRDIANFLVDSDLNSEAADQLLFKLYLYGFESANSFSEQREIVQTIARKYEGTEQFRLFIDQLKMKNEVSQWKRGSSLLLADALLASNQPGEAMTVLMPLIAGELEDFILLAEVSSVSELNGRDFDAMFQATMARDIAKDAVQKLLPIRIQELLNDKRLAKLHVRVAYRREKAGDTKDATVNLRKAIYLAPELLFDVNVNLYSKIKKYGLLQDVEQILLKSNFAKEKFPPLQLASIIQSIAESDNHANGDELLAKFWTAFPRYRAFLVQHAKVKAWLNQKKFYQSVRKTICETKNEKNTFSILNIFAGRDQEGRRIGLITRFLDRASELDDINAIEQSLAQSHSTEQKIIGILIRLRMHPDEATVEKIDALLKGKSPEPSVILIIGSELERASKTMTVSFYESHVNEDEHFENSSSEELFRLYTEAGNFAAARKLLFRFRNPKMIVFTDKIDRAIYLLNKKSLLVKQLLKVKGGYEAFWVASFMKKHLEPFKETWEYREWDERIEEYLKQATIIMQQSKSSGSAK